jgi:AmmeMemoRadiSam system protein B
MSVRGPLGPAVAGSWYPAESERLAGVVDGFVEADDDVASPGGPVAALIAPHAGFVYSGAVAGRGFARLRDAEFERVLLLGPSHHHAFRGGALPAAPAYRTPLGEIPIDREVLDDLAGLPGIRIDDRPFLPEHSLEAEIPFLQRCLAPGWKLAPLLIGAGSADGAARDVADALRRLLTPRTLVVVSSDFTHFGPRFGYVPFDEDVPGRIEKLDMGAVELILQWDRAGFEDYVARTGATICGRDAIGILMRLIPEGLVGGLAGYDTSGRMTGEWGHCVSYASLVFHRPAE